MSHDPRFDGPVWDAHDPGWTVRLRAAVIALASTVALVLYFSWLLRPSRVGNPVLFAVLIVAELFNVVQATGFWWTCLVRPRRHHWAGPPRELGGATGEPVVDVFIPTYDEPVEVVAATVAAAVELRGAEVRVAVLDDGNRD